MRRFVALLAILPVACAPQANDTQDPPRALSTPNPTAPDADDPPKENGPPEHPSTADCVSVAGLPPGSIPESVAQWADLDLSKLEVALPEDARDPNEETTETTRWQRGDAGHPSPLVMRAIHPPGAQSSIVSVTDLQDVCYCGKGMGERLHRAAIARGDVSEEIDSRIVAMRTKETVTDLRAWVADRCELLIRSPSRQEADALFRATDWDGLEQTCSARDARTPVSP